MENQSVIYDAPVVEFVTVSAEFCRRLEQCASSERPSFVDVMCKILPLLYLKASLLPPVVDSGAMVEHPVREEDYDYVASSVASVMGGQDDYLDVFVDDFKYSDCPIRQTISENLADLYQSLRNFVEIYRRGFDDATLQALFDVRESFEIEWGQKLLNALRALHDVKYVSSSPEV